MLGALPPADQQWTLGKTAASVAFVNEGEQHLFHVSDPVKYTKLRDRIDRVKSGQDVIEYFIEDWDGYVENL